jgi:hypothetical protein
LKPPTVCSGNLKKWNSVHFWYLKPWPKLVQSNSDIPKFPKYNRYLKATFSKNHWIIAWASKCPKGELKDWHSWLHDLCSEPFRPAVTLQPSCNPGRTWLMDKYPVSGDKLTPSPLTRQQWLLL